MTERAYKLQDVYDFLKEYYNLEWRHFFIIKDGHSIQIQMRDFNQSCLRVPAVMYHGETKEICWLSVSNRHFQVYGHQDDRNSNKRKNKLWLDFIAKRHGQEQEVDKAV